MYTPEITFWHIFPKHVRPCARMKSSWQLFPFSLGLLPEYVIDVPQLHFEIERYFFYGLITQTPRLSCLLIVNY